MVLTLPFLPAPASCVHLSDFPVSQKAVPRDERRRPLLSGKLHFPSKLETKFPMPMPSSSVQCPFPLWKTGRQGWGLQTSFLKSAIGLISWFNATVGKENQSWVLKKCQQANGLNGALSLWMQWVRAEPVYKLQWLCCLEMTSCLKNSCNLFQSMLFFFSHINVT